MTSLTEGCLMLRSGEFTGPEKPSEKQHAQHLKKAEKQPFKNAMLRLFFGWVLTRQPHYCQVKIG